MIIRVLAATNCRDGNCPTVWATGHGSVIVQGFVAGDRTVRVPAAIIEAAAAASSAADTVIPSQTRGALDTIVAAGEDLLVTGRVDTVDVRNLVTPDGEAAVEVPVAAITRLPVREAV